MKQLWIRFCKSLRLLGNPLYRRGLFQGVAAAIEHVPALRDLGVQTVIDVGANKGQFSLLARNLFPDARIHTFEPLAEPAESLRYVFASDEKVLLHICALGPESGECEIHIAGREDSSSLLSILPRQAELYPGTREVGTRTIVLKCGDDVLDADSLEIPLLIKLDVQGYEKAVLEGMPRVLARATYVYTEVSFQELYESQVLAAELIRFLQETGFRLEAIYNLSIDEHGQPVYADALFTRAD